MHRLAEWCLRASGWRRAGIAFGAGALGALALPPLGLWPVFLVSFPIAVWLLDGAVGDAARPARALAQACGQAAFIGWAFGFGYHLAGLWWLGAAFLVEPDKFAWLLPLGVVGLPAVLALFCALGFALARLGWSGAPARVLWFAAALTASEVLRGTALTGFPWNAWGMAFGSQVALVQSASLVGLYGLTALAVLMGALPAACVAFADSQRRLRLWPLGLAALIPAAMAGFGLLRVPSAPSPLVAGVKLRIMQPNIAQSRRFDVQGSADLVKGYLDLSDRPTSPTTGGLTDVTHLVWPESPFPFALSVEPRALATIANTLGGKTVLLTGGIRLAPAGARAGEAYNSFFVLGRNGQIADTYDKVHLVPFGEYLPMAGVLKRLGLRQFVELPGGFEPGAVRRLVAVPGLPPVQPLICYEAIFPGEVMPQRSDATRPGVLVNITNDAWFGQTPGPHQHFAQARMRAVEEGVPLVRAANSGISAVVDGYGRVVASLPLGATGVVDAGLPRALAPPISARWPALAPVLLWLALAIPGLALRGVRRRSAAARRTGRV